ncbi:acyl-CoA dehydrogenase [Puniceibacterium sp. IMCC21224]|uniref:acyl-CoA dehydrogenase n=1 Tax=Puniceibacterium sp. IMCC21224 TaxID=1618204 RepID=UPI00064DDBE4|nr:acyl-CoA dehydrogenase [Puniceibacterium sp. IMCC21224]KMK65309.1 hypothetical protein IMCC21224_11140 [Puniceibacterium sp. IMCC21224]
MTIAQAVKEHDYSAAIGRQDQLEDQISTGPVSSLAATLDLDAPGEGQPLPGGWHWLFFNPFKKRSELGVDGHPKRGGFLPDVALPRRMWAGGRLRHLAVLPIGEKAEKHSEILKIASKSGRAGQLVFVTVLHKILLDGKICIEEEQDIVYREAPSPGAPKPLAAPAPEGAKWSEEFTPDPVALFRYSSLTSNSHRIHYDKPYATGEEGYPNLVVHGPLIATLLQGFAAKCRPNETVETFDFRGMAPLFVDRSFHLEAKPGKDGATLDLWARGPDGALAMSAVASFKPEVI